MFTRKVQNITPDIISIEEFDIDYFTNNKENLLKRGLPFIVRNFFEPLNYEQIITKLLSSFHNLEIMARKQSSILDYSNNRTYEKMMLKDFLNNCSESSSKIFPYTTNFKFSPTLLYKLNIHLPFDENLKLPRLWIGSKDTQTPLHKDSTDNFCFQLFGKKEWSLFSVKDNKNLYFEKNIYGSYDNKLASFETSPIDFHNLDYKNFPLSKNVNRFQLFIEPGDFLFIPYGWGHSVKNLDNTIMINNWFELKNYVPLILK